MTENENAANDSARAEDADSPFKNNVNSAKMQNCAIIGCVVLALLAIIALGSFNAIVNYFFFRR